MKETTLISTPIKTISKLTLKRLSLDTLPRYNPSMINATKQSTTVVIVAVILSAISKKGTTGTKDPIKLENPWVNILM